MRRLGTICRVALLFTVLLIALCGCKRPPVPQAEESVEKESASDNDGRGFDPLELDGDQANVPSEYPQDAAISTGSGFSNAGSTPVAVSLPDNPTPTVTAPVRDGQVFRVQLFTDKVYGQARQAVVVAQEIFDREVYLDYEVPYYKVRVGDFLTRAEAEDYQLRAKAAGYPEAWVVAVTVAVKEPTSLYPADSAISTSDEDVEGEE